MYLAATTLITKPLFFMRPVICFICLLFAGSIAFGQSSHNIGLLLAELKRPASDSARMQVYSKIVEYYGYPDPDSAMYYVQLGLKEFTEKDNKDGIASMTGLAGFISSSHGHIEIARNKELEALRLFTEVNDRRGIATMYNGLGVLDIRSGNYKEATKYFMMALKEFDGMRDVAGTVNTYMKLGAVNESSGNLDKALEYYNKAIGQIETRPVPGTELIYLYNNIGIVYARKGDMQKALDYFEQALKGSDKPSFLETKILTLINLGIVYDRMGDDKTSLHYYNEALKLTKDKNREGHYAKVCINLALVLRRSDPDSALAILHKALALVTNTGQRDMQSDIYSNMVDIYAQKKDFKTAFEVLMNFKILEDSLFGIEKSKEIADLQSVYELERSNAKVTSLEESSRKNATKRNIIASIAAVLTVTLILLTYFYTRSKRLNAALSEREAELKKTNTIKDKLFSIIGHDLRGPIGNIPVMLELLNSDTTDAEEKKYLLDSLTEHSQASKETLDKLLYWGQAQIKGIGMKQVLFDTDEYVRNNLRLVKSSAEQKKITLADRVPADVQVYAEPVHFDFILRNLVSNAIKFTHTNGTVTVGADTDKLPGYTVFYVRDTGIGIAPEKLSDIFHQPGVSTMGTANEKGTSIGLMLCKEFVTENGGKIWAESEPGKGSVFYFSLRNGA